MHCQILLYYLATRAWASMWCTPIIGKLKLPAIFRAFRTPTALQAITQNNSKKPTEILQSSQNSADYTLFFISNYADYTKAATVKFATPTRTSNRDLQQY